MSAASPTNIPEGPELKARLARCLEADELRLTSAAQLPVELFRLDVTHAEEVRCNH